MSVSLQNKKSDPVFDYASAAQMRAADPSRSVWVNASAGTGKTKVLIERVLRLLLPRADGTPGTYPDRILCLTYTKAAAGEMTDRLLKKLSGWSVMQHDELFSTLEKILGTTPTAQQIHAARGLFTQLADGPRHIRIMTIHAFCQSILARFPIEAGLVPGFRLIEDAAAKELVHCARQNVFIKAGRDPVLQHHLDDIAASLSDDSFFALLNDLFFESRQLRAALDACPAENRARQIKVQLGLPINLTDDMLASRMQNPDAIFIEKLGSLAQALGAGTKTDQVQADQIATWLARSVDDRIGGFDDLIDAFFKADGDRRAVTNQGVRKKDQTVADQYIWCGDYVADIIRWRDGLALMRANVSLLYVADEILSEYERLKRAQGAVDFDDLIAYTARLLRADQPELQSSSMPSWVMYKLDGGIEHILLDEAQDTNPQQWAIIRAIAREFYTHSDDQKTRTLFVVGDQKQSIYRFQGADPDSFEESLGKLSSPSAAFDRVIMNTSFRTTAPVLNAVDHIFDNDVLRGHIREKEKTTHIVSRVGQAGRVELWPMITVDKPAELEPTPWEPPIYIRRVDHAPVLLARKIARTIRGWLDDGYILPSRGRAVQPKDILILVRKRLPHLPILIAALRAQNIPVSGLDRMALMQSLAVQDILSVMRFVVTPGDDLSLACFLKSPLVGMNDDDLIHMAPGRVGRLFDAVQKYNPDVYRYLTAILDKVATHTPYQFFSDLLQNPCPGDVSGSGMRALRTRLGLDAKDPVEELLNMALDAGSQSFAAFLHMLDDIDPTIKRDAQSDDDVVRLMTVHGSKGLEAPIVILPDTVLTSHDDHAQTIFWPDETGQVLPLWCPRKSGRPDVLNDVLARVAAAEHAEYNRLLYVALTRAQDQLIIAGAQTTKSISEKSWYHTVRDGLRTCSYLPGFEVVQTPAGDHIVLSSMQQAAPDRAQNRTKMQRDMHGAVPVYITRPVGEEESPARPYRPDRASMTTVPQSPFVPQDDPTRFLRGTLTHKLLQVLPDIPHDQRAHAGTAFLEIHAAAFSNDVHHDILCDVFAVMDHPALAGVFGPGSRAERFMTGMVGGRLIAGRVDRICITPERIVVVDYKTTAHPPAHVSQVSGMYIRQMRAYYDMLIDIYPDRPVMCVLIYTHGPVIMPLTPDILGLGG